MDFSSVIQSPYPIECRIIKKFPLEKAPKGFIFDGPRGLKFLTIDDKIKNIWCSISNEKNQLDIITYRIFEYMDEFLIDNEVFKKYQYIKTYFDKHGFAKHLFIGEDLQ